MASQHEGWCWAEPNVSRISEWLMDAEVALESLLVPKLDHTERKRMGWRKGGWVLLPLEEI